MEVKTSEADGVQTDGLDAVGRGSHQRVLSKTVSDQIYWLEQHEA